MIEYDKVPTWIYYNTISLGVIGGLGGYPASSGMTTHFGIRAERSVARGLSEMLSESYKWKWNMIFLLRIT